ncbi:MAG: asparagine synthase C-terminal domain-containing protein [Candidatus Diapherotrites archaeon]
MVCDIRALRSAFDAAIGEQTKNTPHAAVLFSGGLDSSLVAKAVSLRVEKTELFSVGTEGAQDLDFVEEVADEMGLKLHVRTVRTSEIPAYVKKTKKVLGSELAKSKLQLQIAVPEFIALEQVKKHGFPVFFSGQGGDELFCGYSSFKRVLKEGGYKAVDAEIASLLEIMPSHNLAREEALASHFSLEHRMPLTHPAFVKAALKIPAREKITSPEDKLRKHSLRALARELGVPEIACARRKKAIQYGSGVAKVLRK